MGGQGSGHATEPPDLSGGSVVAVPVDAGFALGPRVVRAFGGRSLAIPIHEHGTPAGNARRLNWLVALAVAAGSFLLLLAWLFRWPWG